MPGRQPPPDWAGAPAAAWPSSALDSAANRKTWPVPSAFQGSTSRQSAAARKTISDRTPGPSNSEWLVATITTSASCAACPSG